MTTQACMGGWCARRDYCPHFHAMDRRFPVERLCPPHMDGFSVVSPLVRMPLPSQLPQERSAA